MLMSHMRVVEYRRHGSHFMAASDVLARAFLADPAWVWAIPDDARRARVLSWFFGAVVRYGHGVGEVRVSEPEDGAVILLPPDKPRLDSPQLVRAGLWQMVFRAGPGGYSRFLTMRRVLEERHDVDVGPRHWYVWLLGVDPPRQGHGVGSALLASVCTDADRDGVPCYLDTTNERNLAFYRRHGFEVVYEGEFPRGGPHLWTLVRTHR
jgi:ribosomal protein S18 acetylase RimI-like enzyme